ncbi:MAG: PIG-L family deacetylase [Firmicutes bacterium]|jgi:LmbE family N-acetylglucosaminyl deacetylase|nr:PIG-L family deacetylase [Bacillota bacterium]
MKKAMLIYAHPDDESIITGGTIRKMVEKGYEVDLICATRGEASTAYDRDYVKKEHLPEVREKELIDSCQVLGISKLYFMDYLDGSLKTIPEDEGVGKLIKYLNEEKPNIVITFEPDGISHHSDHKIIHSWTMKALSSREIDTNPEKIYWATEDRGTGRLKKGKAMGHFREDMTTIIDITGVIDIKTEAIKCHRSQIKALENNALIEDGKLIRRNKEEFFIRVDAEGRKINVKEDSI